MTPDEVRASYREALEAVGEPVVIRRLTGTASPVAFEVTVAARVKGYQPEQLVNGVKQGEFRAIVLVEDLIAAQLALPVKTSDRIVVRGKERAIQAVDDNTGRVGTTLVFLVIAASG